MQIEKHSVLQGTAQFGDFVLTNQEKITRRWIEIIDRDADMKAPGDLTYGQLLDHLPVLCTELGAILKRPSATALREQAERDASAHGRKRWQQGYKIDELIWEICLIRRDVLETWLVAFAGQNRSIDDKSTGLAGRLVNRFFDDVIIDSAVQFAQEQNDALCRLRARLEVTEGEANEAKSDFLRHVSHALREPLGAIVFAAQALSMEESLSGEAKENVRIILRNLELESSSVDELLLAAQLHSHGRGTDTQGSEPGRKPA